MQGDGSHSAIQAIQEIYKVIVNVDDDEYIQRMVELRAVSEPTKVMHMMKSRLDMYKKKLTEVRYHKHFNVRDALKGVVQVCQPDAYLVAELMAMWNTGEADKTQVELTKILAYARKQARKAQASNGTQGDMNASTNVDANKGHARNKPQHVSPEEKHKKAAWTKPQGNNTSASQRTKQKCHQFAATGTCTYGAKCRFEHDTEGTPTQQVNNVMVQQLQEMQRMQRDFQTQLLQQSQAQHQQTVNNIFSALADGNDEDTSSDEGLRQYMGVYWTKRGRGQVLRRKARKILRASKVPTPTKPRSAKNMPYILIDGATDIDVLAGRDSERAQSLHSLESEITYSSVGGEGASQQGAVLDSPLVPVTNAVVVAKAPASLVSHKTIHDAGFDIVYTQGTCTLVKGKECYSAIPKKGMFYLPTTMDPRVAEVQMEKALKQAKEHTLRSALRRMKRHQKAMHKPKDPSCKTCAQALTEKPPSRRGDPKAAKAGAERGLVVGSDYIVGLPESKNGMNAVFVMVATGEAHVVSAVACKDRSGKVALEVYKEAAAKLLRNFPIGTEIARFHTDGEKSFIGGELKSYLKEGPRNIWPTKTEGYDHNANAFAESVIKQLSRSVRAGLLECTGGRDRYQEIWDDMYEHAADVYNHLEYDGREAPVRLAGGVPVDVMGDGFHVFGAEVLRYVAPERRSGKLDMPARIACWAGRSDQIANGHKVFECEWNDRTKSYDLGPTTHVADVQISPSFIE